MGPWKQSCQGAAIDLKPTLNAVTVVVRRARPSRGWLLGSPRPPQHGGDTGDEPLGGHWQREEDLKPSPGLPVLRLSQAGALLQTTQAHAEIIFTGSAI